MNRIISLLALVTIVVGLAMALTPFSWFFDVMVSFVPQFVVGAVVLIILLILQKRFVIALGLLLMTLYLGSPLVSLWYPNSLKSNYGVGIATQVVRLMHVNLNNLNQEYEPLLSLIEEHKPTIITLNEVSTGWEDALTETNYEYRLILSSEDHRGMGVLSQMPFTSSEPTVLSSDDSPILKLLFSNLPLTLFNGHSLPPITSRLTDQRNAYIRELSKQVREETGSVIVAADLNVTMHSPVFQELLERAQLRDARGGFGWKPSWMANTLIAAPIDHVLVRGDEIHVSAIEILSDIGSDHRPVLVDLLVTE